MSEVRNAIIPLKMNECYLCGGKLTLHEIENYRCKISEEGLLLDGDQPLEDFESNLICQGCGKVYNADNKGGRYFIQEDIVIKNMMIRNKLFDNNPPLNPFQK